MRAAELKGRDPEDLRRELTELQRGLFDLNFRWQAVENPDTNQRREMRRDIARYKTVLRQMDMEREAATEPTE